MFKETFQKVANYPWSQKAMQTIYDTPVEVAIGAVLGALIVGGWRYEVLTEREGRIPVAFSEFKHIGEMLKQKGRDVQPLTRFGAQTNDALMPIFEANNLAREVGLSDADFARELEYKTDPAFRVHKLFSKRIEEATKSAGEALNALQEVVKVKNELPVIIDNFEDSYEDDHDDVMRLERQKTGERCDKDGKNCEDIIEDVEVYDHTDHTYTYHADAAYKADSLLGQFLANHPVLQIDEQLVVTDTTHADNEYVIERSNREALDHKIPNQEQLLMYANAWATGLTLEKYRSVLPSERLHLAHIAPIWKQALGTAKSDEYPTRFHFDSGPKEFQIANEAKEHAEKLHKAAARIIDGITFAQQKLPVLNGLVQEFIHVTLDRKKGDSAELREEILDTAREIYQKNYENGLDVQPFKWWDFLGFTLLGAMGGAAVGAGVDKYLNIKRGNSYDL